MGSERIRVVRAGDGRVAVRVAPTREGRAVFFPSIGEYSAYDAATYDGFRAATRRNSAYADAVRAASANRVVLDIGTGRDALWSIVAAQAGALRVYAVEAIPEAAADARGAVERAGVADVVTVVEADTKNMELAERVQVCISEVVGNIASAEGMLPVLADVRRRLCVPDCVMIPYRCQTRVAAVTLDEMSDPANPVLATEALPYVEQIFELAGRPFDLRLCVGGPLSDAVRSSVGTIETIDAGAPANARTETTVALAPDPRLLTGLLLWPEVQPAPGQQALDGPTSSDGAWAPVYVPMPATGVRPGDRLNIAFSRVTSRDGRHPDYTFVTHRCRPSHARTFVGRWRSPHLDQGFRKTDFYRRLFPRW